MAAEQNLFAAAVRHLDSRDNVIADHISQVRLHDTATALLIGGVAAG